MIIDRIEFNKKLNIESLPLEDQFKIDQIIRNGENDNSEWHPLCVKSYVLLLKERQHSIWLKKKLDESFRAFNILLIIHFSLIISLAFYNIFFK